MEWTKEAEDAVKRVPFFVRKKVRIRIEKEAVSEGKTIVTIGEVKATQARFLSGMESEIKGFQLDACFGRNGCPNRVLNSEGLLQKTEKILKNQKLLEFLKERVKGNLKFHHEFRVTLADCPNACSQPQIKDIGIIGASIPILTDNQCSFCEACIDGCKENAIEIDGETVKIDDNRCLYCGKCVEVCPTGTISAARKGYRVQLGGKLGRHPRLAHELEGIYFENEVLEILGKCINFYKGHSKKGERFSEIFKTFELEILNSVRPDVGDCGRYQGCSNPKPQG